jgi:uncharacterized linocin/CFP29 family protein
MNNLHRELAPISDEAWDQIDDEARRTLKRYLAARKVVDLAGPRGIGFSSVGTGHVRSVASPIEGVGAVQREVKPLVEFRAPFTLSRQAIDDVERGALDSDWQPVKDAARQIAFAEDRAVFDGFAAAGIEGVRQAASNPAMALPAKLDDWPEAVEEAVNRLRLAGVEGPYMLVLGERAYTDAKGGAEDGYPLLRHIKEGLDDVVWAPAIQGGFVLSKRGGDFELTVGQDFSIGYLGHTATTVELYLQESMTFRVLTAEAAVPLEGR